MDLNATGAQSWPLTTGNNDQPTLTQGAPTSFFCNTVPDRCPTGPLAYLLPYVVLTISGTLTQAAETGELVYYDRLRAALIDSIDWITCWHGTAVSANHVKGAFLPLVEYVSGGYRFATRQRPPIAAGAGAYHFKLSVAIPASSSRLGKLLGNTSQLALLFQTSQIKINVAPASVLDDISPGATFSDLTARCSAKLVPTTELVLGTPVETILHQTVAGTNSPQVQIKGFGTDTMLNGVQPKGGVVWLGELTSVNGQGGVFEAQDITQYSFPWRGQQQTQHPEAILSDFLNTMVNGRPQTLPQNLTGGDSEFANYPYAMSHSDEQVIGGLHSQDLEDLLAWIMVQGGDDLQLTDVQTADADQSYFLSVDGGFDVGTHLILAQYAKAWTPQMVANWVGQITKGGSNSLAAYVLGNDYLKAKPRQRIPARYRTTTDQLTYLPYQFQ